MIIHTCAVCFLDKSTTHRPNYSRQRIYFVGIEANFGVSL